ncbi:MULTISPECIES: DUF3090 domain-containing protein [unclassified Kitasatospora]|uniref:DUF3090 domain-containing protein n=1 Tax=unclassified Kitasatospora TaxID=2633591 RepID=UPI00070FBEFB|nr:MULTISPECIES: DUF3090 domain-containing protein [unclassified Kitasatospora]KQV14986.1 hypothetical protein ASC99_29930 [Kitasatospora sp. Root107]KRB60681.1 hypothetical protein ASE03_09825 [Kitasatospora sp. Root187]
MPRQVHFYDQPERFVVGTVGQPGARAFFLQASARGRITSVLLEKAQVAALAERVDQVLDEALRRSDGEADIPAVAPAELIDSAPLDLPLEEEFRVGTMALAWDGTDERLVVEAQAVTEAEEQGEEDTAAFEDEENGPDLLRVRLSGAMARVFAKRALDLVAAGRKPCPFCNLPLDPEGHLCPRANGYRR